MSISIRAVSAQRWTADNEPYFQPMVEVWIGGRRFDHECDTMEEALKLAVDTARDLGISVDE